MDKEFDIVIVDGRDRVNCIRSAMHVTKEEGIIVLDDSERDAYQNGINYLLANDFKRIDFWGIAPGIYFKKCTTIFYKKNNNIGL